MMATEKGYIKRVDIKDFSNVRNGGIRAISLDDGDSLVGVSLTEGDSDCILSSSSGMAIRFAESDARVMGRTARGSRGINLKENDQVVGLITVKSGREEEVALLTACEKGYGKRTLIQEYRKQSRGGKGVIDIKTTDRNGQVVGTCKVTDTDEAMVITTSGKVIRMPVDGISLIGRNTMGVRLVNVDGDEVISTVARIADNDQDGDEDEASDSEAPAEQSAE